MWDLRCCAAGRAHWSPFGTGGALKCSVGFPPQALISGELDILKDWCYEAVSEAPRDSPRAWDSPLEMGLFWGVFCLTHCEFELAVIQGLPGSRAFPDSVGGILFGSSFLPSYCAVNSKIVLFLCSGAEFLQVREILPVLFPTTRGLGEAIFSI